MSRRVLVTGGSGFVGQWLARAMLERGWTVVAGSFEWPAITPLLTGAQRDAMRWLKVDVRSDDDVERAIQEGAPDFVVHLAGIAFAPEANASPIRAFDVNALGVMRLLQRLQTSGGRATRVLVVGSAEQYGRQEASAFPIAEEAALRPLTPYAVAKASQEMIALQAFRAHGQQVICTRSFNHSGVGHGESYLLPTLVRKAAQLPKRGGILTIGNGDVVRDYLHVSDVVDAYLRLLDQGVPGEVYNVCSGVGIAVRDLAGRALARMGVAADVATDVALVRPVDVPILVGDNAKLRRATGWSVTRQVDDILDDLINAAPR